MNEITPDTAEWATAPYIDAEALPAEVEVDHLPPSPVPPQAVEDTAPPELREAREAVADELQPFFARADELEAQMRGVERRSTVLAETARGHLTAGRRAEAASVERPAERALYINSATSEELQELGLSRTQAARLIARRDARGGFESLAELDRVPGLPGELRAQLKRRASGRA